MPPSETSAASDARARWLFALLSLAAVALPFVLVRFPPSTDLPQQVAQIRLLGEALDGAHAPGEPAYTVDWLAPNRLSYVVLGLAWQIAGPADAGRLGLLLLAWLWVGGLHALAAVRGRSPAAATLGSVLVFHHALAWGYLGFLLGFPCFLLWLHLLTRRRSAPTGADAGADADAAPASAKELAALGGAGLLLYAAHVLWLAAALLVLAVVAVAELWRARALPGDRVAALRRLALRGVALLPVAVLVALWYPSLPGRFGAATELGATPWQRLASPWMIDAAFGALRGPTEGVYFAVILLWLLAAGLALARARARADTALLGAGLLLVAGAVLLPARYSLVLHFASRWMAPGLALLLLALPRPVPRRLPKLLTELLATALLLLFAVVTGAGWLAFERAELAGLPEALDALPDEPALLGLDFQRTSVVVESAPFYQLFAYGQVLRGGTLNFSFADLATSLVTFEQPRMPGYSPETQDLPWRWTPGLEWHPERLRPADLRHFSHVLVHGGDDVHQRLAGDPRLEPQSTVAAWHLYVVDHGAVR